MDLLEDINETMNRSVNTLIQTTCTQSFRQFHLVESSLEGTMSDTEAKSSLEGTMSDTEAKSSLEGTMSNTEAEKGKVYDHDELKRRRRWIH